MGGWAEAVITRHTECGACRVWPAVPSTGAAQAPPFSISSFPVRTFLPNLSCPMCVVAHNAELRPAATAPGCRPRTQSACCLSRHAAEPPIPRL